MIFLKRIFILTLIFMLIIPLAACGGGQQDGGATQDEGSSSQSVQIGVNKGDTYVIEAGGLQLKYPAKWKDKVKVELSGNKAAFTRGDDKIFDILFNSDEGNVLGTVKGDKNTVISVVDYKIKEDDAELSEMIADLNVIINNLAADYDFALGERIVDEDNSTFEIETPVVTLKYPAKWKDKVTYDITDKGVMFSSGGKKVFDLMFVEGDGYLLGTYNDTPIYVVDYPVTEKDMIDMQADINVILKNLREDSNFKDAE